MQKKTVYLAGQKKPFFFFNDWEAKQNAEK